MAHITGNSLQALYKNTLYKNEQNPSNGRYLPRKNTLPESTAFIGINTSNSTLKRKSGSNTVKNHRDTTFPKLVNLESLKGDSKKIKNYKSAFSLDDLPILQSRNTISTTPKTTLRAPSHLPKIGKEDIITTRKSEKSGQPTKNIEGHRYNIAGSTNKNIFGTKTSAIPAIKRATGSVGTKPIRIPQSFTQFVELLEKSP